MAAHAISSGRTHLLMESCVIARTQSIPDANRPSERPTRDWLALAGPFCIITGRGLPVIVGSGIIN
jgi:hypothetical protein